MNLDMDAQRLEAAGLEVRRDAVGNTFARWTGSRPELPAVAVGALGGLDAIRALQAAGYRPQHPVDLIRFAAAEPAGFGVDCLGSRLLTGAMPVWKAARLTGADGRTFDEWRAEMGFEGPIESAAVGAGHYAAFVELQVERGGLLEKAGLPLGIATAFAAPAGLRVTVEAEAGQDAPGAAAEIALEVEKISMGAGTANRAAGSVPGRVRLEIYVEDLDQAKRDAMVSQIAMACRDTAQRRRLTVKAEVLHMDPRAECAAEVVDALARAARAHSLGCQRMAAGGRYDALFLSRIAPAGTLLAANAAEAATGALVLADAVGELAG
jgi:N-carbamoyl-L-amino-acid hydrolase